MILVNLLLPNLITCQLIDQLKSINFPPTAKFISYNVQNLFYSIPKSETILLLSKLLIYYYYVIYSHIIYKYRK